MDKQQERQQKQQQESGSRPMSAQKHYLVEGPNGQVMSVPESELYEFLKKYGQKVEDGPSKP